MCRIREWQPSLPYFLSYFPLTISDVISCLLHYLKTVWNKFDDTLQLCRTGHDNVSHTGTATLAFILSELFALDGFRCNFVSAP